RSNRTRRHADFGVSNPAFSPGNPLTDPCAVRADPAFRNPTNCVLAGMPGNYPRGTAEVSWRRTIVDSWGEVFTPFATARLDAAALNVTPEPGVSNYLPTADPTAVRAVPAVRPDYRYPFTSA